MKAQLTERLEELQIEYEKGQKKLLKIDEEGAELRSSILRISGAIQVLQEELEKFSENE